MRLIVSAPTENPIVWSVTKIENFNPIGIQKLTLYQDFYNPEKDEIIKDENGKIVAMYADYYDSSIIPTSSLNIQKNHSSSTNIHGEILSSTPNLRVGGSYKNLTLKVYDSYGNEITDKYSNAKFEWSCYIEDNNKHVDLTDKVTWRDGTQFNQKKLKFPNDRSYLGKNVNIKCTVSNDDILFESESQFGLIIL